jgi:hypothetical protein
MRAVIFFAVATAVAVTFKWYGVAAFGFMLFFTWLMGVIGDAICNAIRERK